MAQAHPSKKHGPIEAAVAQMKSEERAELVELPLKTPLPRIAPNSGLYTYALRIPLEPLPDRPTVPKPIPIPEPGPEGVLEPQAAATTYPLVPLDLNEELRLDVDGNYPQMKASGKIAGFRVVPGYWIANVRMTAPHVYEGDIWYKDGNRSLLPFTNVTIVVTRTVFSPQSATVTFSGGGVPQRVRTFTYKSRYFHSVNFEFDAAEGVTPILTYDTGSHPNRPASLPAEALSIATVYRRAGFDVSISTATDTVPIAEAHADAKWSDAEMHDAMQVHWSKFANKAQWALWTFFASLHEMGTSLGGIMFDDIGPNHRQGTSLFLDSFIKNAPAGDPAPAAWVNRMIFWTACHEMGHSFNLAHSWQKSFGVQWIPLVNEPLARSFMNYPYNVPGGTTAFFGDFEFRFSDGELLFLRHAPYNYVQQGNADWFDHHAFQQANVSPEPKFSLALECAEPSNTLEFLEPAMIHLVLENVSDAPQLVSDKALAAADRMTIVIKKRGQAARELLPYATRCWKETPIVLQPHEKLKDSVFLVGRNGWDLAEPGMYKVQASIRIAGEDVVSTPLRIRVTPPKGYDEQYVAQEFFSDDVGRVLNFDGSVVMETANNALREVVARLPKSRAAIHSKVALAAPLASDYKQLDVEECIHTLKVRKAAPDEAASLMSVLGEEPEKAASTLGRVDFDYYRGSFKGILEEVTTHHRKR